MGERAVCLLHNKELVESVGKLKDELAKDFAISLLEECPECGSGLEKDTSKELHARLATIYVELSKIEELLNK